MAKKVIGTATGLKKVSKKQKGFSADPNFDDFMMDKIKSSKEYKKEKAKKGSVSIYDYDKKNEQTEWDKEQNRQRQLALKHYEPFYSLRHTNMHIGHDPLEYIGSSYNTPLCVTITNDSKTEKKQFRLFGPSFNEFKQEGISTPFIGTSYEHVNKSLLNNIHIIGHIRLSVTSVNKKIKINKFFKDFLFYIIHKSSKGHMYQAPHHTYLDLKKYQLIKNIVDVRKTITLDSETEFTFELPPQTTLHWHLYDSPLTELYKSEHPFAKIIIRKFEEVDKLIWECDKKNAKQKLSAYAVPNIRGVAKMISDLNKIPADFYRNLVEISMCLDEAIGTCRNILAGKKQPLGPYRMSA